MYEEMSACRTAATSGAAGRAAYEWLVAAINAAQQSEIDAITTAPLSKAALCAAGLRYPGHTEILANLSGTRDYAMLLMGKELR